MRKCGRLGALAVAFALIVAVALPAVASDVTVGKFVQRLAQAKNLNAIDARGAVDSLSAAGIRLPADLELDRPLTEGDVTRISRLAGVNVTTAQPAAPFDDEQVDQFFSTFGVELGFDNVASGGGDPDPTASSGNGNGPPFDPYSKGKGGSKGKKKGHSFTPDEPE